MGFRVQLINENDKINTKMIIQEDLNDLYSGG